MNTEKSWRKFFERKLFIFLRVLLLSSSCWFFETHDSWERREFFATGSWITLIISQTQWQEMFSALAERRRLEKINISERALRGKFFEIFSVNTEKSWRKFFERKLLIFLRVLLFFHHVDFFETHDSQGENICHWVVNNPDNFTDPVARNVLCARWEAPSRKINISERALRGKFFEIFSVNTEKSWRKFFERKLLIFLRVLLPFLPCWFFRDARLAGKRREHFCHWVVNNPDNFTDPVARNVLCARWEAPSRKNQHLRTSAKG